MNRLQPVPQDIRTERLVLRRHALVDLPAFESFMANPLVTENMLIGELDKTPEGAEDMLRRSIMAYDTDDAVFSMTVADAEDGTYIGTCGLAPWPDDPDAAEITYTISPEHQGKGYATEAAEGLVDYATENLGIKRVVAQFFGINLSSVAVAEKLGFEFLEVCNQDGREGTRYVLETD